MEKRECMKRFEAGEKEGISGEGHSVQSHKNTLSAILNENKQTEKKPREYESR